MNLEQSVFYNFLLQFHDQFRNFLLLSHFTLDSRAEHIVSKSITTKIVHNNHTILSLLQLNHDSISSSVSRLDGNHLCRGSLFFIVKINTKFIWFITFWERNTNFYNPAVFFDWHKIFHLQNTFNNFTCIFLTQCIRSENNAIKTFTISWTFYFWFRPWNFSYPLKERRSWSS